MLHTTWRVVRGGLAVAMGVAATSWAIERVRFGTSDQDAVARIERELRQRFDESIDRLGRIARQVAKEPVAIAAASRGQVDAGRLFEAVNAALPEQDAGRTGITVYDRLDAPVAWAGRTSELPKNLISGPAMLFVARGAPAWVGPI